MIPHPGGPWWRRVAASPLLHFLVLGAGLHQLAGWLDRGRDPASYRISISAGQVDSLVSAFQRLRQRPPSPAEIEGLVEEQVRQEVYFREALALGLDRGDVVIRRRLRQKMEFVAANAASGGTPEEAQQELYDQVRPRYTVVIEPSAAPLGGASVGER
jgi:hypothetical protein